MFPAVSFWGRGQGGEAVPGTSVKTTACERRMENEAEMKRVNGNLEEEDKSSQSSVKLEEGGSTKGGSGGWAGGQRKEQRPADKQSGE